MSIDWSIVGWGGVIGSIAMTSIAWAQQPLHVAYPLDGYETSADRIFLIGTAPPGGEVTINDQVVQRSPAGHFAPSFPLQLGENVFTLKYQDQVLTVHVTRTSDMPPAPVGVAFGEGSLSPTVDIARLPGEPICFSAIAPPSADVTVSLSNQTIPLVAQASPTTLPPNSAVLTAQNQPIPPTPAATSYQGCTTPSQPGNLGLPTFRLQLNGETIEQPGSGGVEILNPSQPQVVEVTADSGTARTGPSTDYSRLTPLPKGTQASVTGREGEWFRLDYGAWIRAADVQSIASTIAPRSLIRSVRAHEIAGWTEIEFPLQVPVPVSVQQGDRTFTLTLHNTTAQTDTILLNNNPLIERLDWQQSAPGQVQYTFNLKTNQQWGYKLRYEGTTLILSLRHPPFETAPPPRRLPLQGVSILLDPGHGGPEDSGALGPTGYPEKDVTLAVSKLLRDRLIEQG
ncbi:MAG TPA: N-acetylmuramoyl-L-alanine amidase, partial [Allocoleopsis sp.]